MLLGALVACGAPVESMQEAIDALGLEPVTLCVESVARGGIAATRVLVGTAETPASRNWAEIRELLTTRLPGALAATAGAVFERLARAEAQVHGESPEQVHFHEVGALDAIADVVGVVTGLQALGVGQAGCAGLALGGGTADSAHGTLPVPAPAVLAILQAVAAPVWIGGEVELTTPTGAALLATTVGSWGVSPPLIPTAHGYGAGSRDRPGTANVVGLVVGEPLPTEPAAAGTEPGAHEWAVTEANVDDLDPRLWPGVLAALLAAGAVDAWLTPVLMKKGRPAHTVHALAPAPALAQVRSTLYRETSTIGLRSYPVAKHALARAFDTVEVSGLPVRVKLAWLDGQLVSTNPEFDDVLAAADRLGLGARDVLAAANLAAQQRARRSVGGDRGQEADHAGGLAVASPQHGGDQVEGDSTGRPVHPDDPPGEAG